MSRPVRFHIPITRDPILIRLHSPEHLARVRDRLFRANFVRISRIYARVTTSFERKLLEFLILTIALLSLLCLVYIHTVFLRTPSQCLAGVESSFSQEGILRVEVILHNSKEKSSLEESYLREEILRRLKEDKNDHPTYAFHSESFFMSEIFGQSSDEVTEFSSIESENTTVNVTYEKTLTNETKLINSTLNDRLLSISDISEQDAHILEYSQEHGFLKLSHRVRKKLLVPVHLITINPDDSACFGGMLDKFFVQYVLGYDDVLLLSLKLLAEKQNYKGYVRNVVTGSEYVFVNIWMDQKSYLTAAFSMFLFTASVSLLLRHSDHQIFVFIVEVLHMLEFHSFIHFPAAPLLTVILALVGLEAVLSEFFQDTAAAFHVILVVWMADQYRTVCCSSPTAKKHWIRFFLLYHFFFYGYTFRFGHNLYLAFFTSCLFIFHSMIYFYHRYELPLLIHRELSSSNTSNGGPSNHAPEPSLDRNDDQETIPDNYSSETEPEPAHATISQGTSNQPQSTEDLNVTSMTTSNNSLIKRHKSTRSANKSLTKDVNETFSVPKEKSIQFLKTISKQLVEDSSLRNCM